MVFESIRFVVDISQRVFEVFNQIGLKEPVMSDDFERDPFAICRQETPLDFSRLSSSRSSSLSSILDTVGAITSKRSAIVDVRPSLSVSYSRW